ncbi:MAG: hypothetical protein EAZ23_15745 [Oscillatoriales cyanobacterium]|nr:MAG: hypothetical protein EAZ23_15745 [Oscillatoriales cyanobacterium]
MASQFRNMIILDFVTFVQSVFLRGTFIHLFATLLLAFFTSLFSCFFDFRLLRTICQQHLKIIIL